MPEVDDPLSLDLYLAYDFLPLRQQGRILLNIDRVFESVLDLGERDERLNQLLPLSVAFAQTGNSIKWKFGPRDKKIPRYSFNDEGELEIILPRWSAAVMLTATLLTGGASAYMLGHEVLETLEPKPIPAQTIEENRPDPDVYQERMYAELQHYRQRYNALKGTSLVDVSIDVNVQQFASIISAPNIRQAIINGTVIKEPYSRG